GLLRGSRFHRHDFVTRAASLMPRPRAIVSQRIIRSRAGVIHALNVVEGRMGIASKMRWEPTLAGREIAVTAMNLTEWLGAMPRFLLLATGAVLGLLALLPGAQGQGRPEVAAAVPAPKVRVLAIARTLLADE